jgi:hypothetical protein
LFLDCSVLTHQQTQHLSPDLFLPGANGKLISLCRNVFPLPTSDRAEIAMIHRPIIVSFRQSIAIDRSIDRFQVNRTEVAMSGCFPWNRRGSRHGVEAWVAFPWIRCERNRVSTTTIQQDTEFLAIVRHPVGLRVYSR